MFSVLEVRAVRSALVFTVLVATLTTSVLPASSDSAAPAQTPPPVLYLASADSSSTTNSQSTSINYVFASAARVANEFKITAVRLSAAFDPTAPEKLCTNGSNNVSVRDQDVLVVFSIAKAEQNFNKFSGGSSEKVELNFTQIYCPGSGAHVESATPPGAVSRYWGPSNVGSHNDFYWANPVSGVAAAAALLTSPWVNKYRLWLAAPTTILESARHDQAALEGAIYCATAEATLETLHDRGLISLEEDDKHVLKAYRLDPGQRGVKLRVPGVNRCKEPQPAVPSLAEESLLQAGAH